MPRARKAVGSGLASGFIDWEKKEGNTGGEEAGWLSVVTIVTTGHNNPSPPTSYQRSSRSSSLGSTPPRGGRPYWDSVLSTKKEKAFPKKLYHSASIWGRNNKNEKVMSVPDREPVFSRAPKSALGQHRWKPVP